MRHIAPFFVISIFLSAAFAQDQDYSFNFEKLEVAYKQTKQLAPFPGNMSSVTYDLANKTVSYSQLASLPVEALNSYRSPTPSDLLPAPKWISDYLKTLEVQVFSKRSLIKVKVSDTTPTQMFYEDKVIVIHASELKKPVHQLKFIIAHEFSHFILYGYQMSSPDGLSPLGFTGIKLWHPEVENLVEYLPSDYYLDHAEVDVMACLLMQELKEPVTTDFISEVLARKETIFDGKPLPATVVKELEIRLRALSSCRDRKK